MAYLSSTSAKITPENYSARVKSITVRVCITNCTGILYITVLWELFQNSLQKRQQQLHQ